MNKEFIPYEEALVMRKLGFDEPCFGYYNKDGVLRDRFKMDVEVWEDCQNSMLLSKYCSASLYQQAFRWFREKYKLNHNIFFNKTKTENHSFDITGMGEVYASGFTYNSYEEAELACLQKLIKIVQDGKN